jgi:uncharacterized protein (TIGR03435 family)
VAKNGPKLQEATQEQRASSNVQRTNRGLQMDYQKAGMALLVNTLANLLGRPVLDQTGLAGRYNFKLEWADDRFQRPGNSADSPSADVFPGLFTALQEQLGLRMEVKKGPVNVLVVDHAEKPTEN